MTNKEKTIIEESVNEPTSETNEEPKTKTSSNDSFHETEDQHNNSEETSGKNKNVLEEFGEQIGKFATSTIDTLKKGVDKALVARNTVLTIRVTDKANKKLSMLVEAGLFKSRSESASFLIEEGIKQQSELFAKISKKMEEIESLRNDLKNIVSEEFDK